MKEKKRFENRDARTPFISDLERECKILILKMEMAKPGLFEFLIPKGVSQEEVARIMIKIMGNFGGDIVESQIDQTNQGLKISLTFEDLTEV